jgi:uncharacterized protein (TIGR00661 family)
MKNNLNNKKILFAISSLGLGHATRELALINKLLKNNTIHILSTGGALNYLKKEINKEKKVYYYDYKDYPPLERGRKLKYLYNLLIDSQTTKKMIKQENIYINNLINEKKIDVIISDGKYGSYSNKIPSFLITHQISFALPKPFFILKPYIDYQNISLISKFSKTLILDNEKIEDSYAGLLSHPKKLNNDILKHEYIGIMSSYEYIDNSKNVDYLFMISGYLMEHKDSFINKLIEQAKKIDGKKIFALGDMTKNEHYYLNDKIEIYSHISGKLKQELFNSSSIIISRSGYSTIMDLIEHDKHAVIIPTFNQNEQIYLAKYHSEKNYFSSGENQNEFELEKLIDNINFSRKLPKTSKTNETINRIENIILEYL